jgi:hypothetical protein|tara:strand:- start:142 stop:492 length:351 start_codon:yes stop_codon:yes gene_type:complete
MRRGGKLNIIKIRERRYFITLQGRAYYIQGKSFWYIWEVLDAVQTGAVTNKRWNRTKDRYDVTYERTMPPFYKGDAYFGQPGHNSWSYTARCKSLAQCKEWLLTREAIAIEKAMTS